MVLAGRTESTLVSTRDDIVALGRHTAVAVCDVTEPADVDACIAIALDTFGSIDILVNNAALVPHGSLLDIEEDLVEAISRAGPSRRPAAHAPLPSPPSRRRGHRQRLVGRDACGDRAESGHVRHGEMGLERAQAAAAAMEWAADGIRVNTIMPFAKTDAVAKFLDEEPITRPQSSPRSRSVVSATPRTTSAERSSSSPARTPPT